MPRLSGEFASGYSLEAPNLEGQIKIIEPEESLTRSAVETGVYEEAFGRALESVGIATEMMFELEVAEDKTPVMEGDPTRSDGLTATTRDDEPAIILTVPYFGENVGYAVFHTDEAGVSRWILPEEESLAAAEATRGGSGGVAFHLPRNSAPQPPPKEDTTTRGEWAGLKRRGVRVLTWLTGEIIARGAGAIARLWENKNRPYGFVYVQPSQIGGEVPWDLIRQGRALMLVHGTFATADVFEPLVASQSFDALAHHYEKRVFAFNHPSLHHSPTDNVKTFLDILPQGLSLDLDYLSHSRGGLVGRDLAQQLIELRRHGRGIQVNRAVLAAAPNQGSPLTEGKRWVDLIDRYTNLLKFIPGSAFPKILEGILTAIKLLFSGAVKGLPGLGSMLPEGDYLGGLNRGQDDGVNYYALAANYQPIDANLLVRFCKKVRDVFVDRIFGEANDGVVPTDGSYLAGRQTHGFPIPEARRMVYGLDAGINHSNYFSQEVAQKQIFDYLRSP